MFQNNIFCPKNKTFEFRFSRKKKSTIFLEILLSLNFKDTTCHFRPLCYVVKLSREHIQGSGEEKWEAYNYQSRFRNEQSVGLSNVFIRFLHTWHYFLLIESMWSMWDFFRSWNIFLKRFKNFSTSHFGKATTVSLVTNHFWNWLWNGNGSGHCNKWRWILWLATLPRCHM